MRILVIGDIIQDRYVYGTMERLNPEGPTPLVKVTHEKTLLGGAANVWNNLINLGVKADLVEYPEAYQCVKTRVICDGHYVTRIDNERTVPGSYIFEQVSKLDLSLYDYVILSDYAKGALDRVSDIIKLIGPDKVIVDPKRDIDNYQGAWLIKANELENQIFNVEKSWSSNYIITKAAGNITSRFESKSYITSPDNVEVTDVTGAGDCFLAAFVYGLTKKYEYQKCLDIAVRAATISVQHLGTYTLKPEDVEEIVVFTNGCFDILHRGHIEYLEQSRKLGTKLIVGLNSDSSVKRLKGSNRPIHHELDRKLALEALRCVDDVVIFDEDTPSNLIDQVKPDIITKGGDYGPSNVVGNDRAKVIILPFVEGFSTTKIVSKL